MKYTKEQQSELFERSKLYLDNPVNIQKIRELREVLHYHEFQYALGVSQTTVDKSNALYAEDS